MFCAAVWSGCSSLTPCSQNLSKVSSEAAARVTLAGQQYDAGTGATAFIPHGNWIGLENVSSEPAMIRFFFNKPSFEQCLRALSSRPGETFTVPPPEKMTAVEKQCHQVMKE